MNIIDTHTHLYLKQFNKDIDLVINRSKEIGVNKFIFPAIDSSHFDSMHSLKNKYPDIIYLMSGLHPTDVKEDFKDELEFVVNSLKTHDYVAIGEIGIDLYWDKSTLDIQKQVFELQINLAKKHRLPIVIHVRDSFKEAIEIVEKLNDDNLSGVFHCFTGDLEEAQRVINLQDFYLGIGGVVTFKNGGLDKIINQINLDHIILETDSPYLTPSPFRGKRNESKYILNIAQRLSEIYNIDIKNIAETTTHNAYKLFNI